MHTAQIEGRLRKGGNNREKAERNRAMADKRGKTDAWRRQRGQRETVRKPTETEGR
jgi:hypothetical protein